MFPLAMLLKLNMTKGCVSSHGSPRQCLFAASLAFGVKLDEGGPPGMTSANHV